MSDELWLFELKIKKKQLCALTAPEAKDLTREGPRKAGNNYIILSEVPTANQYIDFGHRQFISHNLTPFTCRQNKEINDQPDPTLSR